MTAEEWVCKTELKSLVHTSLNTNDYVRHDLWSAFEAGQESGREQERMKAQPVIDALRTFHKGGCHLNKVTKALKTYEETEK